MAYFLDLFSPTTYEAFTHSDRTISGFHPRQTSQAAKVKPGDKLLCYMTRLSRWFGILEVVDGPFNDSAPIFYPANDPFTVRFHVKVLIWLPVEKAIPIKEDELWHKLSFTKGYDKEKNSGFWAQRVKGSLGTVVDDDANLIEAVLKRQASKGKVFPFDQDVYQSYVTHVVPTPGKAVEVTVPKSEDSDATKDAPGADDKEARESIRIQALLSEIGSKMGLKIWLPKSDRVRVLKEWKGDHSGLVDQLPLNYDSVTLKTIEQIDVLWLKGRSIQGAFEVEHTTSIYSGLLRMADLMALQPNMDIRLHIVAPQARRDKVFQEIQRPVFSLLEGRPLWENCTFLSYDAVRELAKQPNLGYMSPQVLEEFEEAAAEG